VVEVVDTPEEAIAAANRTMYGLTSFDSCREYLQGIRDCAQGTRRNRDALPKGAAK